VWPDPPSNFPMLSCEKGVSSTTLSGLKYLKPATLNGENWWSNVGRPILMSAHPLLRSQTGYEPCQRCFSQRDRLQKTDEATCHQPATYLSARRWMRSLPGTFMCIDRVYNIHTCIYWSRYVFYSNVSMLLLFFTNFVGFLKLWRVSIELTCTEGIFWPRSRSLQLLV
jgi:hypothetical protein